MLSAIDVKKFNTLIEMNTLLNSNYSDLNGLLTQILESATRLCEGEASSILLLDQNANELYFEVALGIKGPEVKKYTLKIGEGIAGWVVQHNKSLIANDVESDTRHFGAIGQQIGYASRNILAVPMRVKDVCIGVIEILNKKQRKDFTQEDLEWLEIFANQAAIALQNAQNYEKAQNKIKLLQDQIKTSEAHHPLIYKSQVIREKLEVIDRIAKTDSSALILGESGVGKELFAEQIHIRSNRCNQPFVPVNCAAIPEGLLESELFGHVKGAFTGAIQTTRGRFEMADKGTIFLDEIGDLPLLLQAKLLRVIQQKTFEKVGSEDTVTVDVRILAATNKDIEALVLKGEFRNDLYYRLNVLPIHIPPLRQRPEDIPELAAFFLKRSMQKSKKQINGFSDGAMEAMLSYHWPGNVRELENCIERACVIGKGNVLTQEDLFANAAYQFPEADEGSRNLKTAINAFKSYYIRKALEDNKWNQTETARALDIQRTYLSRLIKELEIDVLKET